MNYKHAEVATLSPQMMRTLCEEYIANNYIDHFLHFFGSGVLGGFGALFHVFLGFSHVLVTLGAGTAVAGALRQGHYRNCNGYRCYSIYQFFHDVVLFGFIPIDSFFMKIYDVACRRILEAKYKLGLFDNPYKYCDVKRAKKQIFTKEHRAVARKIASESLVLLKNEGNVLPLAKKGTIAVVGPLADSRSNMPGTWSVAAVLKNATSLAEGLKAVAGGKAEILTAKGCNLMSDAEYEKRATMFGRSLHRDNRSDKELLDEALAVAAKSDVIVAALGESSEMSGESSCRTNLEMTDTQRILLQELLKTGKPVVLVLFTGRPLVLNWEQANVPAILNVWFAGSEAGFAIGDVLFGDVNPSGKLTTTFPKSVGQIPLFYNHKNTGRPLADGAWFQKFRSNYIDIDNEPLYPFGFGLSYTTFSYSDVALDKTSMTDKGELTATVTVTNTGKRDGAEVVQLYIRDLVGSVTRPVKELKGFEKIFLKAGESKKVSFKITPELLKFYNYNLDFVCESGNFEVMIGRNSRDVKKATFTLL